ncbi:MAG: proline--tRNA ligase [Clostridiales bacterium]|nr:proline--tRNA ligase [Clostridiales bacterium]
MMRLTNSFFKTFREDPANAEINSHKYLLKAGFIKQMGNGIFTYLPMGLKVLENIKSIIREEMNNAGAIELQMPILLPQEIYANRLNTFGNTMYKLNDSTGKDYCLGPTHEEPFTYLVKESIKSYKQLPLTLYQIQNKYRDEIRARFGLQRAKEFIMKDAYSFDTTTEGLDKSFDKVKNAYMNIFSRLGLDFVPVEADNGVMGGSDSIEFMVKADIGEDELIVCDCGYGANTEKAECLHMQMDTSVVEKGAIELVNTPNVKTIEDVANFLQVGMDRLVKAVVYKTEKGLAIALVNGLREVEEVKLKNNLGVLNLEMATQEDIAEIGSVAGFVGATKQLKDVIVVADNDIQNMTNFVIGGNKEDCHYINANIEDLKITYFADIKRAIAGDKCPRCGGIVRTVRGIEVGHIFKLGTRYTKALECKFLDEQGKEQYMIMGCYGIGISRTLSALVEQNCDEKGMVWPEVVAPYKIEIVVANMKDETQRNLADKIYSELNINDSVLLDDRSETIGVKLNDAELVGIPYIIIVGRGAKDGIVEVIKRSTLEKIEVPAEEFISNYEEMLKSNLFNKFINN